MPASVSRAVRLPGGCAAGVAFISVGSTHTGQSMARYTVTELSSSTTPVSPTAGSVSFVAIFSSLLFAISSLARRFFSIMRALTIQIERPASAGPRPAGGASTGDVQSPESFHPGKGRAVSLDRPPLLVRQIHLRKIRPGQGCRTGTLKLMKQVIGFLSLSKSDAGNSHCLAAAIASSLASGSVE